MPSDADQTEAEEPHDWREWNARWRRIIIAQSGFEWNFAIDVIQRVPGLKPSQVTPQKPFVGTDGRERHMDFAIEVDKVKIAIELEGWDKSGSGEGKTKQAWAEPHARSQAFTAQGWTPLIITNSQFMSDPTAYILQIRLLMLETTDLQHPSTPVVSDASTIARERPRRPLRALSLILAGAVVAVVALVVAVVALRSPDESATLTNPGDIKNCEDFATQQDAQAWFDTYAPKFGDVAKLDGNSDGRVCVDLP